MSLSGYEKRPGRFTSIQQSGSKLMARHQNRGMKTVETERLIMRPFEYVDRDAFFRMGTEPAIVRYVGNNPFVDLNQAEAALQSWFFDDYQNYGYGRFACVWKETGEVIGFSGLQYVRQIEETELGYRFFPEFWGRGIATEAGVASVQFARELGLKRLISLIDEDNLASARVVQKLGFRKEGVQDISFWDPGFFADLYALSLE